MQNQTATKVISHTAVAAGVPVLLTLLSRCCQAQAVTEPSSDKVTNLCTEAKYTEYLANRIVAAAERQEREISDMQIYAEAWDLLAAVTNQTEKRAATYALAAYMSTAAATARRVHNGKYKAAVATAKFLHRRAALTRTLLAINIRGKTIVGVSKIQGYSVSIGECPGDETPILRGDGSCAHRTNDNSQPEGISVNLKTATHIKLLNSSKLRPLGITHLVEIKKTKGPESAEALVERCGHLLKGDHYVKFEASTTEKDSLITVEPIRIFEGSDSSTNCAVIQNESTKSEKDNDLLINKLCKYIKEPDPQIITISSLTPVTLANTTEVQLAFKSFFHETRGKSSAGSSVEAQLQKLYGGDKQSFTRDFVKVLWTKNVTYHIGSGFVTETLLDAVRNKNAQKALIYLEDQRPTEEAKQAQSDESEITKTGCSGKGKQDCSGECTWEGNEEKGRCESDERKDTKKQNETQMRKWPRALQWMMARQGGNCKTIQQDDCKGDCTWDEGACDGAVGISASMNIPLFMAFLLLA
uniref:Variant surface glycoprotein 1125.137 n=1 Tax=Trypanosoma brucei TaxID=5691 RepID=A0A1J0R596_9TRYP|nr:variant surface glycoprotein 1125.137 [Trypanosoma brucei]